MQGSREFVLRLEGMIMSGRSFQANLSYEAVKPLIERAFKLPEAKAVALVINSPGGSPAQSSLIWKHIRARAAERKLPVIAFVEDVATMSDGDLTIDMFFSSSVVKSVEGWDASVNGIIDCDMTQASYQTGKDPGFLADCPQTSHRRPHGTDANVRRSGGARESRGAGLRRGRRAGLRRFPEPAATRGREDPRHQQRTGRAARTRRSGGRSR